MGINRRNKVIHIFKISITILFFFSMFGCGEKFPENYGVYVYTDDNYVSLNSQKILYKGNLLQSITGLNCPAGSEFKKINSIIVYLEGLNSNVIQLDKLKFKRYGSINNITSKSNIAVNMYVTAQKIKADIKPISSTPNMYRLKFQNPLVEGFYGIHFGGLNKSSTLEAATGRIAYDFVLGKSEDYPSYDLLKAKNENKTKEQFRIQIEKLNNLYSNKKFSDICNIYWPKGKKMKGKILDDYVKESEIWFETAGKVKQYKLIRAKFSEFSGVITIKTVYEKIGARSEKFTIRKIENKYVFTSIK